MAPVLERALATDPSPSAQSDIQSRNPLPNWTRATIKTLTRRQSSPPNPSYDPSAGTRPPESFNNKGYFALFALLGVALVIGGIWFFFWADNGGFVWRKNDWDDYKSTVLRRKDANGKTLSNATPRTDLGQKSVAGTFDYEKRDPEMAHVHNGHGHRQHKRKHSQRPHAEREPSDEDMRAYRHEKSAKVGGLNRQHDGSHYDFTNSDYSYSTYSASNADDVVSNNSRTNLHSSPEASPPKKRGFIEKKREQRVQKKAEKKVEKDRKRVDKAARKEVKRGLGKDKRPTQKVPETGRVRPAQRRPSLSTIDAASTSDGNADHGRNNNDTSYYADYRPEVPPAFARQYGNRRSPRHHSPRHSHASTPSESRQPSPLKREFVPGAPGSFDAYSDAGVSDTGTKVYQHHIPGVSRSSGTPTRSNGYRRGGGRRDSLSDSD